MSIYEIIQRSERATARLSYRLKHGMEKLARSRNHLTFLIRWRENNLIPKGLRVSLPVKLNNQRKSREIARKASESLLRALISEVRTKKVRMESEINTYTIQLHDVMCEDQLVRIKKWCSEAAGQGIPRNQSQTEAQV